MTEQVEPADASYATPGAVLASARIAAGLTAADVAGQMRISLRQVESIEADRYDELPGAVFVRGFVRNYARLLNLDPLPLLRALEPALGAEAPLRPQHYAGSLPVGHRRGNFRLWVALFVALLLVVLGAAGYEFWRGRVAAESESAIPAAGDAPAAASGTASRTEAAPEAAGRVMSEPVPLSPERIGDGLPGQPPASQATQSEATGPAAAASGPAAPDAAAPGAATVRTGRLAIGFVAESWVEVRDRDGNVLLSATGTPNTSRTVEGAPPLTIAVGNASGVRISYNDRPVDVGAHATRNIARFTLE